MEISLKSTKNFLLKIKSPKGLSLNRCALFSTPLAPVHPYHFAPFSETAKRNHFRRKANAEWKIDRRESVAKCIHKDSQTQIIILFGKQYSF